MKQNLYHLYKELGAPLENKKTEKDTNIAGDPVERTRGVLIDPIEFNLEDYIKEAAKKVNTDYELIKLEKDRFYLVKSKDNDYYIRVYSAQFNYFGKTVIVLELLWIKG